MAMAAIGLSTNLKDIIATAKAEGLDLKTDEIYNNVGLTEDGFLSDPNAAKLAQVFNVPDYDFAKLQSNVFNMDFDAEPPHATATTTAPRRRLMAWSRR